MQAGNDLTYAKVISKMAHFDESTNGTSAFTFRSHFGDPDQLVYFPSTSFGIDVNRTFEYSGLVVFTDVSVPRRPSMCNESMGFLECMEGGCYHREARCDGKQDCSDRTDEAHSPVRQRWLWRDINIGPHGRFVFTVDVPQVPAHWTVSAFSMSAAKGLGMLQKPIRYSGVLPFSMKVEGPYECRQGEQVGLRVVVFNYQHQAAEAVVVLEASADYKFVHVEEDGIVRSYNPRTSFGEHQFFVWIAAGDTATVLVPVVPARLGHVDVRLSAAAMLGQRRATHRLHVTADGLPQQRHQSVLLDLSNRAYVFQYMHVNLWGMWWVHLYPTLPVNATSLLHLPMDSAEQNMFSFAANMYMTLYMRLINQRNRTLEREAFYHMNVLYQRQLSFMKPDGSFGLFRTDWNQSASSVWLTSFCAKIFQDASFNEWENYIYIDPDSKKKKVISSAVSWVLEHQLPHGAFYEVTWSPDRGANDSLRVPADADAARHLLADPLALAARLNGTVIAQRNITLTAQVVITLETVKNLKDFGLREGLSARVVQAQQLGISWLEKQLRLLDDFGSPLALAVVAYALTFSKAPSSEHAYRLLKRRQRSEGGLVTGAWRQCRHPVQDGEPEAFPAAAAAVQVRRRERGGHRVRAAGVHGPPGRQRAHRHVAHGAAAARRRLGLHAGYIHSATSADRVHEPQASTRRELAGVDRGRRGPERHPPPEGRQPRAGAPAAGGDPISVGNGESGGAWRRVRRLQLHVTYNVDSPRFLTPPPAPPSACGQRPHLRTEQFPPRCHSVCQLEHGGGVAAVGAGGAGHARAHGLPGAAAAARRLRAVAARAAAAPRQVHAHPLILLL
ncbi:hypothetical protein ACJJTC_005187 [Scirpophaga incertulas]